MSAKRMITKLALAFAAKKGIDLLRGQGGIDGLRNTLSREMGGVATASSTSGSTLGKILEMTGLSAKGTYTDSRHASADPLNAPLGELFGAISSAIGGKASAQEVNRATGSNTGAGSNVDAKVTESVVHAMVQTARADGAIDDQEREALFEILGEADADERRILNEALRAPVDAHAVASITPRDARKDVYTSALLVASDTSVPEQTYLKKLGAALGLSQEEQQMLHRAMGRSALAA